MADPRTQPPIPPQAPPEEAALKQRIACAATRLFAQKGFAGVSVREICEAAETTKPMVYYYFGSKEGLFRELAATTFDRSYQLLEQAEAEGWPLERALEAFARVSLDWVDEAPEHARMVFAALHGPPEGAPARELHHYRRRNLGRLARLLAEARDHGRLADEPVEDLALDFVGLMVIATARRLEPDFADPLSPAERARQMVRRFLYGAAAPRIPSRENEPCVSSQSSSP